MFISTSFLKQVFHFDEHFWVKNNSMQKHSKQNTEIDFYVLCIL